MHKLFIYVFVTFLSCSGIAFSQGYQVTGNASALAPDTFLLTPDLAWQNGAVWYKLKHNFDLPFSIQGGMFFGDLEDGADGIVFVLQNECLLEGTAGGGIGYQFLPGQSLGIEFDTYENIGAPSNDPPYDHIGIHRDGSIDHLTNLAGPVQMNAVLANVEDNNWHDFQIDYNPATTTINVYFDGSLRLTYNVDITNTIFSGNPYAYWGFTSATGGSWADNQVAITDVTAFMIKDTTICTGTTQISLPPLNAYNAAEGQVATASSVEGPFVANSAIDGNMATRWSSLFADPQWITVDLGSAMNVDSVHLYWEGAYGSEYIIQTSADNVTWVDQFHEFAGNGGLDQINFSATGVQYVRMLGLQRGTPYGYSLWEFEVYSTGQYAWSPNDGSVDDTTSNTPTFSPLATTVYTLTIPDACLGPIDFNYTVTVDCTVLPVELISFTAKLVDREVDVDWQTATEINNDYFVVERAVDAQNWTNIGVVDGAGNSTQILDYELTDTDLDWTLKGYYYRLKQVDFDGSFKYSQIEYVPLVQDNFEFTLYPNPSNDVVHLIGNDIGSSEIGLYDLRGALVQTNQEVNKSDTDHVIIHVNNLATGVYVVRVDSQSKLFVKE